MSDAFRSASDSSLPTAADAGSGPQCGVVRIIAYLAVAGAIWLMALNFYRAWQDRAVMRESADHLTEQRG